MPSSLCCSGLHLWFLPPMHHANVPLVSFITHLPNQNLGSQFHSTGSVSPTLRALCYLPSPPAASNRKRDQLVPLKLKPRFSGSALNSATFCPKGSPEAGRTPAHSSQWGQQGNTEVTQLSSEAETQLSYNSPSKSKSAKGHKNSAFFFASR